MLSGAILLGVMTGMIGARRLIGIGMLGGITAVRCSVFEVQVHWEGRFQC